MESCGMEGCDRPARSRGWCASHYMQWWRWGDPTITGRAARMDQRFWSKVDRRGPDECWPWLAGTNAAGYGRFNYDGVPRMASRVMWTMIHAPIPTGRVVRHSCDNPICVNPNHLSVGTQADNVQDMIDRGRRPVTRRLPTGEAHHKAKLTAADVRAIRASQESLTTLARRYNISKSNVAMIRHRQTWRHLDDLREQRGSQGIH